jgi:hypothetical protein
MVQAIHRIQEFTAGLSFDDYQASILIQVPLKDNSKFSEKPPVEFLIPYDKPIQQSTGAEPLAYATSSFIATTRFSKTSSGILLPPNLQRF